MICFPLFEGEQITQILLGLFLEIYFREYFSRRGRGVFAICFWVHLEKPLITLMQAFHACAARRCLRCAQTCFAVALELLK